MATWRSLMLGFGAIGTRQFWSFRAVHALAGGLLTIFGAAKGLFVNENIKDELAGINAQIDAANQRYGAIDQALFQFRFAQTNAITFGVLSANDSLKPEFRQSMVQLMFVTRRMPTEIMLQHLHLGDDKGFAAERQAYLDLIEAAKTATSQADWDAVNAFEFTHESKLFDVQQDLVKRIDALEAQKREAQGRLDFAIVLGFALQQTGFVIVLLAGLVHQYRRPGEAPLPVKAGGGGE
jgi:hypothetical protein